MRAYIIVRMQEMGCPTFGRDLIWYQIFVFANLPPEVDDHERSKDVETVGGKWYLYLKMVNLKLVPYNDAYNVRQNMPFVQPSNGLMCPF